MYWDDTTVANKLVAVMSTHVEPMIGIISASLPFLTLGHYIRKSYFAIRQAGGKAPKPHSQFEGKESMPFSLC